MANGGCYPKKYTVICLLEVASGVDRFALHRCGVGIGRIDTIAQAFLAYPRAVRGGLLEAYGMVTAWAVVITGIRCFRRVWFVVECFCHDRLLAPTQVIIFSTSYIRSP